MEYKFEATSLAGFIQQLAVAYVQHGYWFYVMGVIPEHKELRTVDEKLLRKYDVRISRWERARRKAIGMANVHYLRHQRFFVLIATKGWHEFRIEEADVVRDVRRSPIAYGGYSVGYRKGADQKWHASVRIHPLEYRWLKSYFVELATHRDVANIGREFRSLPFEPYAPIRRQLLNILRAVNRQRKQAGLAPVPHTELRLRRRVVRPFEDGLHAGPNVIRQRQTGSPAGTRLTDSPVTTGRRRQ